MPVDPYPPRGHGILPAVQERTQVDGGGGLARPTLLIRDPEDIHRLSFRCERQGRTASYCTVQYSPLRSLPVSSSVYSTHEIAQVSQRHVWVCYDKGKKEGGSSLLVTYGL